MTDIRWNASTADDREVVHVPQGWYADPAGVGMRYWDGAQWTEHQSAPPPPPNSDPGTTAAPSKLLDKAPAILRNRKVLVCSVIVLAAVMIGCTSWIAMAGGSSGYKEQTISFLFGQQTIRTKGSAAQICSDGKWVPIKMSGSNITIPGGTRISVGGAPCSNSGAGTPPAAVLILITAAVLEVVTLGLLFATRPRRDVTISASPAPGA
jgi:hypothetical protein